MEYEKQVDEIIKYIKDGEKKEADFMVGTEIEHFIIYKDSLKTVSYYGEDGVESTFKDLIAQKGWKGEPEGDYILTVEKEGVIITLEPGSQFEFNSTPKDSIDELADDYFLFLEDVLPILEAKGQTLVNIGYHPRTKIDEITILPKQRYDFMFNYFKEKGDRAHNMMKGTAALQMAIDFSSEEDYIKKYKVINGLSPVLYAMLDNGYYFEGDVYGRHNLRAYIWENTDKDRSGVVPSTFDKDFGYRKYAEYILDNPPIFIDDGEELYYTGDKNVKDIFDPEDYKVEALEHAMTMFFPDVRTKHYIEIRMMDSVPYPLSFAVIAFWKGILYNQENLDKVYKMIEDIDYDDIMDSKEDIYENGLKGKLKGKTTLDWGRELIEISKKGLSEKDLRYIDSLEELINNGKSPYDLTKERADQGLYESIKWAITDKLPERI